RPRPTITTTAAGNRSWMTGRAGPRRRGPAFVVLEPLRPVEADRRPVEEVVLDDLFGQHAVLVRIAHALGVRHQLAPALLSVFLAHLAIGEGEEGAGRDGHAADADRR